MCWCVRTGESEDEEKLQSLSDETGEDKSQHQSLKVR